LSKICHVTSVHERFDIRIYFKECRTLASAGLDIVLLVADGLGDEISEYVQVRDAGRRPAGRLQRMSRGVASIRAVAFEIDAAIYHLHDPELLPLGLELKRRGKIVIFDSHEDYVADMMVKPYLPAGTARMVASAYRIFQTYASRRLDLVIAATPAIASVFETIGASTVTVNNYPLVDEIAEPSSAPLRKSVIYAGAITRIRGFPAIVDAIDLCRSETNLLLAGPFTDDAASAACRASPGWVRTEELGVLTRARLKAELAGCLAGLVVLEPVPTFVVSRPNKLFEYMANGLAVIASDFPAWRQIVEGEQCGICVDPTDPRGIAAAIDTLAEDPERARTMGERGRLAVIEKFNWNAEGETLLGAYRSLGVH
jgi:glycosyltransferase involved in cell wall biosynthesis